MKSNKYTVYPSTVCLSDTPVLSPAVLGGIKRLSMRYTLPPKCPITRDDLIQEGCLAILEYMSSSITGELHSPSLGQPCMDDRKAYSIARKAMQQAMTKYLSPVTHSLDTEIGHDDNGAPITLLDKLASDILATDDAMDAAKTNLSLALSELLANDLGKGCPEGGKGAFTPREHLILTRLYGLDGTPPTPAEDLARHMGLTYNNIRKIKQRILKKLHDFLSQNPS